MKVLLLQAAFRLPDDFKIGNKSRERVNAAIAALLTYRRRNTKGLPKGSKPTKYRSLEELWNELFTEQVSPKGAKLIAQFGLTSHVWPPKPVPKKRRTR